MRTISKLRLVLSLQRISWPTMVAVGGKTFQGIRLAEGRKVPQRPAGRDSWLHASHVLQHRACEHDDC